MRQIRLDNDIQPLSEFRSKTAFFIKQVNEDKRPLILTQHGKSIAVVLSVSDYENMREKSELIEEIKLAEYQIERGLGITHENAVKQINRIMNK
jgi:prevent-host-death family protein